jgi:hypothetical protein
VGGVRGYEQVWIVFSRDPDRTVRSAVAHLAACVVGRDVVCCAGGSVDAIILCVGRLSVGRVPRAASVTVVRDYK